MLKKYAYFIKSLYELKDVAPNLGQVPADGRNVLLKNMSTELCL